MKASSSAFLLGLLLLSPIGAIATAPPLDSINEREKTDPKEPTVGIEITEDANTCFVTTVIAQPHSPRVEEGYEACKRAFDRVLFSRKNCTKVREKFPALNAKDIETKSATDLEAKYPGLKAVAKDAGFFFSKGEGGWTGADLFLGLEDCVKLSGGLKQPWEKNEFQMDFVQCRSRYEVDCSDEIDFDSPSALIGGNCVKSVPGYVACSDKYSVDIRLARSCPKLRDKYGTVAGKGLNYRIWERTDKRFQGLIDLAASEGLENFDVQECFAKSPAWKNPKADFDKCLKPITKACSGQQSLQKQRRVM